jgi:plasmid stabilization system protein ParE
MKVRWSETAVTELEAIFVFILAHNRSSAKAVARRIIDRAESLGEFPLAGRMIEAAGIRKLPLVSYPYVIFYKIDITAGEVQILNVRHTARKQLSAES